MAGLFFSHAKALQPARGSWFHDLNDPRCNRRDGLHACSVNDEALSKRDEARADGNDPQAGAGSEDP